MIGSASAIIFCYDLGSVPSPLLLSQRIEQLVSMAEEGRTRSTEGKEFLSFDEGEQSWSRVVHGASRGSYWTAHKLPVEELEQLQAYFTKVLELPKADLEEARWDWQGLAVVFKSLGRRVSAEWVAKEVRSKANLASNPDMIPLAENHLVVRLRSE